jgi:leucyl aminopeptidase
LVLADALAYANAFSPDLTLDFATLTGAARTALGPELVPFYTDDHQTFLRLLDLSNSEHDPLWPMPLWHGYESAIESDIADLKNDPSAWAQAGSIMAALFLKRFAPTLGVWVHFDIYGWNPIVRHGQKIGAKAQALRASYELIKSYCR